MKKLINQPEDFARETVEGILLAHGDRLRLLEGNWHRRVRATRSKEGKVASTTGGGSGQLPLFLGYTGEGLVDGCTIGNVFASPSAEDMYEVDKACHRGAGILHLYGNYGGDLMNFGMAQELCEMDDIEVREVLGTDDVASAPKGEEQKRRGVAGLIFAYKTAGAAAEAMLSLDEVTRIARETCARTRTMGVALTPCIVPEAGKATFSIGEDEMEIGMGIHGEPGIERTQLKPIDEVVSIMMEKIFGDMEIPSGAEVAVMVNGLGATPREELYLAYRRAHRLLDEKGVNIHRNYIGEFAGSLEMAGLSISIFLLNDELKGYLDAPCDSPFFRQG